ncbi:fatty acid desaturase [Lichenicoccus sp.]|uniref:fatty acid desaturase n=1 Tax=Lichenicoccus sp. TaxID=2781899 RepID=UPI003D10AEF7
MIAASKIAVDNPPAARHKDEGRAERRRLVAATQPFQGGSARRSAWQFASTFGMFIALNALMYRLAASSYVWLLPVLALPAAGLLVRLFIIQHDCGHGSFFRSRRLNDWLGRVCSIITVTPYAFWLRQHGRHHGSFNNLDRREPGIDLYSTCTTLAEFEALPPRRQLLFRLVHHPLVAQILLPPFVFLVLYRFPFDAPKSWRRERASVHLTNAALLCVAAALVFWFGLGRVLLVQLPTIALTSIVGVWLFTVQHRFEAAQWQRQQSWNPVQAAIEGSSYLKLPRLLQYFTGSIGFHHVHHLAAKVPNYRLQACHQAQPGFATVTTLSLRDAFSAPGYLLWDETKSCMTRIPRRRRAATLPPSWVSTHSPELSTRSG